MSGMLKNLKRVFLVLAVLVSVYEISISNGLAEVHAADSTWQSEYTYTLNDSVTPKTIQLTKYNGTSTVLTVPATATIGGVQYETHLYSGDTYDTTIWYGVNSTVTSITIQPGVKLDKGTKLFYYLSELKSVDISGLVNNTAYDLNNMFGNCSDITSIDMSGFDTTGVTKMSNMFMGCNMLTSLNLTGMDTSSVTDMNGMFFGCGSLTTLDVSGFNTSNVIDMSMMFTSCRNLTSIDVSNFDTSNVTNMNQMFSSCVKMIELNLNNFNTSKVTSVNSMFYDCTVLKIIRLENSDMQLVTTATGMFGMVPAITDIYAPKNLAIDANLPKTMYDEVGGVSYTTLPKSATSIHLTLPPADTTWQSEYTYVLDSTSTPKKITISVYNGNSTVLTVPKQAVISGAVYQTHITKNPANNSVWVKVAGAATSITVEPGVYIDNGSYLFANCSSLAELNLNGVNTSATTTLYYMFNGCSALTTLNLSSFNTSNVTNMCGVFRDCRSLINLVLGTNFSTIKVTNMSYMFTQCNALTSLDLSNFNTSSVTTLYNMFNGCNNLISLNVSSFDTTKVTNMSNMFYFCRKLTEINVNNFNTAAVTNMSGMFGSSGLTSINLSNFDMTKVTDTTEMIQATFLTEIDTPKNLTQVVVMPYMTLYDDSGTAYTSLPMNSSTSIYLHKQLPDTTWQSDYKYVLNGTTTPKKITINEYIGATGVTSLIVPEQAVISGVVYKTHVTRNASAMFKSVWYSVKTTLTTLTFEPGIYIDDGSWLFYKCSTLTVLELSGVKTPSATTMREMFDGCSGIISLDLSSFDTAKVTSMGDMFSGCNKLVTLNLSSFDTTNVTDMSSMFYYCNSLTTLDVSRFSTANVTNMNSMFHYCSNLANLNLSNFDTPKVTSMGDMFNGCNKLVTLDLSSFNTANVTDMSYMFYNCYLLNTLNISNFDTSKVTTMSSMFNSCSRLDFVDVSSFNTVNVTNMHGMFGGCGLLKSLNLSSFNTLKVTDLSWMFYGCSSLVSLDLSSFSTVAALDMGSMFSYCMNLTNLDISNLSVINVTDTSSMFESCQNLVSLNLGNFDMSKVTTSASMLNSMSALTELYTPINLKLDVGLHSIMVDTELNSYIALPKNSTGSIHLTKLVDTTWQTDYTYTLNSSITPKTITISRYNGTGTSLTVPNTAIVDGVTYVTHVKDNPTIGRSVWYNVRLTLTSLTLEPGVIIDTGYGLFRLCSALTELNLTGVDTSNVTTMYEMFYFCNKLSTLDLSSFDTSKVTNMQYMFSNCSGFTSIDTSSFNTSKVTNMASMFKSCTKLTSIDLSNYDMTLTTAVTEMLYGCTGIKTIETPKNVTVDVALTKAFTDGANIYTVLPKSSAVSLHLIAVDDTTWQNDYVYTLNSATVPKTITITKYKGSIVVNSVTVPASAKVGGIEYQTHVNNSGDTSLWGTIMSLESITIDPGVVLDDGYALFSDLISLSNLVCTGVTIAPTFTSTEKMFNRCEDLSSVDLSWIDTSNVTNMSSMFRDCTLLATIDLSSFNTTNTTNMGSMFRNCSSLITLTGLNTFNTANVFNMGLMFENCCSLSEIDLSNFDTSNVSHMSSMFGECESITVLDISSFNTSNVIDMTAMFNGCTLLENILGINTLNTSNVQDMQSMFSGCEALTTLDLSSFNTSNVIDMTAMFNGCLNLTSINISSFDTSNVLNMTVMFCMCPKLALVDVSSFNTSKVTSMFAMFAMCSELTSIQGLYVFDTNSVINIEAMFYGCSNLVTIDTSSFSSTSVTSIYAMFTGCSKLTEVDLSGLDLTNMSGVTNSVETWEEVSVFSDLFGGCASLVHVKSPKNLPEAIALPFTLYDPSLVAYTDLPVNSAISIDLRTTYTVQFYGKASVLLDTKSVRWNELPVAPDMSSDDLFTGWDTPLVAADTNKDYYAQFATFTIVVPNVISMICNSATKEAQGTFEIAVSGVITSGKKLVVSSPEFQASVMPDPPTQQAERVGVFKMLQSGRPDMPVNFKFDTNGTPKITTDGENITAIQYTSEVTGDMLSADPLNPTKVTGSVKATNVSPGAWSSPLTFRISLADN